MNTSEAIECAQPYTKTSHARLCAMADGLAHIDVNRVCGDVVECGVWKAGNIILTRLLSPLRVCWLYDTFTGMTEPENIDVTRSGRRIKAGKAAISVREVVANLNATHTFDQRFLKFVKGPVEDTLKIADNLPDKIALLRLDTDFYRSTRIELEVLWPRLEPNGILIVDDFGHWQGSRKAVEEYFVRLSPRLCMTQIDYSAIMMTKPQGASDV